MEELIQRAIAGMNVRQVRFERMLEQRVLNNGQIMSVYNIVMNVPVGMKELVGDVSLAIQGRIVAVDNRPKEIKISIVAASVTDQFGRIRYPTDDLTPLVMTEKVFRTFRQWHQMNFQTGDK